jgi:hypothetical protein
MATQTLFQSILTLEDHCKEASPANLSFHQPPASTSRYMNGAENLSHTHTVRRVREVYHSVHLLKLAHQAGR